MTIVMLSSGELDMCESIGMARNQVHTDAGIKSKRIPNDLLRDEFNILGCKGELAVSKYLGLPWDGKLQSSIEEFKAWSGKCDVCGFEVRTTKYANGHMRIKPFDKHTAVYILVICMTYNELRIAGWARGYECRTIENWHESWGGIYNQPCHLMPQEKLHDIKLLKENK